MSVCEKRKLATAGHGQRLCVCCHRNRSSVTACHAVLCTSSCLHEYMQQAVLLATRDIGHIRASTGVHKRKTRQMTTCSPLHASQRVLGEEARPGFLARHHGLRLTLLGMCPKIKKINCKKHTKREKCHKIGKSCRNLVQKRRTGAEAYGEAVVSCRRGCLIPRGLIFIAASQWHRLHHQKHQRIQRHLEHVTFSLWPRCTSTSDQQHHSHCCMSRQSLQLARTWPHQPSAL